MSCNYNYKGKEYTSKQELMEDVFNSDISAPNENLTTLEVKDEWARETMLEDAKIAFGTNEFITVDGNNLHINQKALADISSNIKEFTKDDGSKILVDIDKLANNPENMPEIPEVHSAVFNKILDKFENFITKQVTQEVDSDKQLKEKLVNFANQFGITIKALDEYEHNYGGDVQAVADIFNKIIAISNQNDLSQLSEEVSHFAIEYFNDKNKLDQVLENVPQTNEYKANKLKYVVKYSKMGYKGNELENKVRKEVLGKILSQKIQDNFQGNENNTIFETLRNLWNEFLQLFNITNENRKFFKEFGTLLDDISMSVIDGKTTNFDIVKSKEVYFSLSDEQLGIKSQLEGAIDTLEENYKAIIDKPTRSKKIKDIKQIRDALLNARFLEAVQAYTTLVTNDVKKAKDSIEASKRDNPNNPYVGIGDNQLTSLQIAKQTLTQNLDTLANILTIEKENPKSAITKIQAESIEKDIRQARDLYNSIATDVDNIINEKSKGLVQRFLNFVGATPDQRKAFMRGLNEIEDTNGLMRWIKSPVFMGNSLFQLIVSKVLQANNNTHRQLMDTTKDLEQYLKENDISESEAQSLKDGHYMTNGITAEGHDKLKKERDKFREHWDKKHEEAVKEENYDAYKFAVERDKAKTLFNAKYQETPYVKKEVNSDLLKQGDLITNSRGDLVGEYMGNTQEIEESINKLKQSIANIKSKPFLTEEDSAQISKLESEITSLEEVHQQVKTDFSKGNITLKDEFGNFFSLNKTEQIKTLDGFVAVHPDAKNTIKEYNAQKYAILRKYFKNGKYDFTNIRPDDLTQYKALLTEFRRAQSKYTETGTRKQGLALTIANDIEKYYKGLEFEKDNSFDQEFEQERQMMERNLSAEQYQRWLSLNANFTYPQDIFDKMEDGGLVIEGANENAGNYFDSLGQPYRLSGIMANLGLNDNDVRNLTVQELYDLLKTKRQKLVAPYKESGQFNQIQGELIDDNKALSDEIANLTDLMGYFNRKSEGGSIEFESVPNEAFIRRYTKIKESGNNSELQQFLSKHAVKKDGKYQYDFKTSLPLPKTYYYRTYEITQNGQKVGKSYVPSFTYMMSKTEKKEENPLYSYSLAEKGIVQFSEWFKQDFRNEEFFDKFGIDADTDFYAQQGANRNEGLFGFRQLLLDKKAQIDKKEGIWGAYHIYPAVPPSNRELLTNAKSPKGLVSTVKGILSKKLLLRSEDDDLGIGDNTVTREEGGFVTKINYRNKIVARYRGQMDNPNELTTDVTYAYLSYLQEGISANERAKIIPQVNMLLDRLERTPLKGNTSYKDSNIKKVMDDWLSTNLYGQSMDAGYILNAGDTKISTTKLSRAFYGFSQMMNLGLNTPVAVTGLLNASMQSFGEKYINYNVGEQSINFGFTEAARLTPEWIKSIGDTNPNAKIPQLLRFAQMDTINEVSEAITMSKGARVFTDSASPMAHLKLTSNITAAYSIIMVYDAYRLMPIGYTIEGTQEIYNTEAEAQANANGKEVKEVKNFVTQRQYLDQASKMYDNYNREEHLAIFNNSKDKSFYSYLNQAEDNQIVLNEEKIKEDGFTEGLTLEEQEEKFNTLRTNMNRNVIDFHSEKEGQLAPEERAAISRQAVASHLMLHRGWMVRQIHQRLNKRHYNPFMGTEVEGSYTTLGRLTMDRFGKENGMREVLDLYATMASFGLYKKGFEGLSELERSNVKRLIVDQVLILASGSLFLLATALAGGDEGEDSALAQYVAYNATRNFNEIMSTQLPYVLTEYKALLEQPIPGLGQAMGLVQSPYNLMTNMYNGEEVRSGQYKDLKKWQRDLIKLTFYKNVHNYNDPSNWKGKSNWLRNQSWTMKNLNDIIIESN